MRLPALPSLKSAVEISVSALRILSRTGSSMKRASAKSLARRLAAAISIDHRSSGSFRLLARLRRLRGTAFDIFGYTRERPEVTHVSWVGANRAAKASHWGLLYNPEAQAALEITPVMELPVLVPSRVRVFAELVALLNAPMVSEAVVGLKSMTPAPPAVALIEFTRRL